MRPFNAQPDPRGKGPRPLKLDRIDRDRDTDEFEEDELSTFLDTTEKSKWSSAQINALSRITNLDIEADYNERFIRQIEAEIDTPKEDKENREEKGDKGDKGESEELNLDAVSMEIELFDRKRNTEFTDEDLGQLLKEQHPDTILQMVFDEFEESNLEVHEEVLDDAEWVVRFNEDWRQVGYNRYKELHRES